MLQELEAAIPEQWKGFYRVITLPIIWVEPAMRLMFELVWIAGHPGATTLKRIFLVLPAVGVIVGLWCSMFAVYTILFRSNRIHFMGTLLIMWWDMLRCTWYYWAGMGKFLWMLFGSIWGMLRLTVGVTFELIRESFELPFELTGTLTKNLRQPGIPWIAFSMTLAWSLLEAGIFSYILTPTFSEIMSDLVGSESHMLIGPVLFVMLFFMIAGSFACMHVLVESINKKDVMGIVKMSIVEVFVMFIEVMFLYRELVDALTPWIATQTGVRLGIVSVILMASFGWMGVRAMVWFLFARFGTPTLLAFIARERLSDEEPVEKPRAKAEQRWGVVLGKIKQEQDWFQGKAEALLAAAVLPVFQVVAACLNFAFLLLTGRPLFSVPFQKLEDVKETKSLIESMRPSGRRAA